MQDLEAKIVVLGAQGVGKTSLLNRFIHNSYKEVSHPTIGANFLTKKLVIPDYPHITIRLQIWDTAGQERFRSISKLYYRGAHAALLCYDITDATTFDQMGIWLQELRQNNANTSPSSSLSNDEEDPVIHVVGTKADVVTSDPLKRQVPFERCISYVSEHLQGVTMTPTSPITNYSNTTNTTTGSSLPSPPNTSTAAKSTTYPNSAHTSSSSAGARTPTSPLGGLWDRDNQHSTMHPTNSNRHSGFWGADTGWDCCHEISSKDGEGVEEVFRVIARKLVEQRLRADRRRELEEFGRSPGAGSDGRGEGYFDGAFGGHLNAQAVDRGGSFRLGYGDKRRSWLGLSATPGPGTGSASAHEVEDGEYAGKAGGRCC